MAIPKFLLKLGGAAIAMEVASLAGTYAFFHSLNTSPWFRYKTSAHAPIVVDTFYVLAEKMSPEAAAKAREEDIAFARSLRSQ